MNNSSKKIKFAVSTNSKMGFHSNFCHDKVLRNLNSQDSSRQTLLSTIGAIVIILSDDLNTKIFMGELGIYGELCIEKHSYDILQVEFPGRNFVNIEKTLLTEGIFPIKDRAEKQTKFENIITPFVESGDFSYNNINNMHFTDTCSQETYTLVRKMINEVGIHIHLTYDPFYWFPKEEYYLMDYKNGHLTFAPLNYIIRADQAISTLISEIDARTYDEIMRSNILLLSKQIDINSLKSENSELRLPL